MANNDIRRNKVMALNDPRHGSPSGYHRGCRCSRCRTANSAVMREHREAKHATLKPEDHGKHNTYVNANCRCEPCREANREYNRRAVPPELQRSRYKARQAPKVKLTDLA